MPVLLGIPALIRFIGWLLVTFFTQFVLNFLDGTGAYCTGCYVVSGAYYRT